MKPIIATESEQPEIADSAISVTGTLGFARQDGGPDRSGGFSFGTFQSEDESAFHAAVPERFLLRQRTKGSHLTNNEADAALASASFYSVVLKQDLKAGPLRTALDDGGKVLDMRSFQHSGRALADYIESCHNAP